MKLKKQRIGSWIGLMLLDLGIVLLAASGWESRGHRLHPLLELGLLALAPGIVVGSFTQRCPFCGRFLGILFFIGKQSFFPHCGTAFEGAEGTKKKGPLA